MEQETNLLHLLKEHQFFLFLAGALIILGLVFLFGILIGRRTERRQRLEEGKGSNKRDE